MIINPNFNYINSYFIYLNRRLDLNTMIGLYYFLFDFGQVVNNSIIAINYSLFHGNFLLIIAKSPISTHYCY
jgi:hypothetical protein